MDTIRGWSVGHNDDTGYYISLYEDIPLHATIIEDGWNWLCDVTRGWVGGHGLPEIFWKIPLGRPQRDPRDGWLENSVAGALLNLENRILLDLGDERKYFVTSLPLTLEEARKLSPDFVSAIEGEEESD